jgi:hypothetical protein
MKPLRNGCVHSFALSRSCGVAQQLERETQALLASLEEKVERRLYELRMPLAASVLKKIRLSAPDLKVNCPHLLPVLPINLITVCFVDYWNADASDEIGSHDATVLPKRDPVTC